MSINSALWAGATGLLANSSALAAVSDNIANVNTVGYKRAAAVFRPVYDSHGVTSRYAAGGVTTTNNFEITTGGLLTPGTSPTDMAIAGNGFFVVRPVAGNVSATDAVLFTRSGSFSADSQGNLRNDAGLFLYGWPVAQDGSVTTNPSDLTGLEAINLSSIGGAAEATTSVGLNANLQASQPVSASEATYDPTVSANNMASGGVTPDFQRNIQVYDSQGGARTITISMLKSSTANQWHAELHVSPTTDITTGAGLVDGQIATGTIAFDANGEIDLTNTTLPLTLDFLASNNTAPLGATQFQWAASTGVAGQSIDLDIGSPTQPGGMTQYDSPSALTSTQVNGSAFGTFTGVEVDSDGFVYAKFSNGIIRKTYQVPIATFVNANGLNVESGGAFSVTPDSGSYTFNIPGTASAGTIASSTLENSNVDLATEFTSLITTQRAYSASSKIITTADEMLDEAIRMKR
ncbi:flagellar hook protein FlgE [Hyphobacterium sp. HN65]|uniref:Flagellar hook protein FlgE n=1 Tax=Hyphobacterium lacteum TaxID=3116575 RepID=A0ABU7LQC6_9PROT|nr:flagellar hook protein FlgE [Hyphobacterium sp. HN65]MEE2526114.1 flagellar hook protein FlgE [Hyphobacterium sp. HN65]